MELDLTASAISSSARSHLASQAKASGWLHAATALTVAGAVFSSAFSAVAEHQSPLREELPMFLVGILYVLVGTWGLSRVERGESQRWLCLYFLVMTLLMAGLLSFSRGAAWYAALPLLSHAALHLSLWSAGAGGAALVVVTSFFVAPTLGDAWEIGFAVGSAVLFVMTFTLAARREIEWRTRADRLSHELQKANRQLLSYSARIAFDARTEERNRLAREVHDGLGHYLTAIHIQLEASLVMLKQGAAGASDGLRTAQSLARRGLEDVRQSVSLMREPEIEGTVPSLAKRLEDLTQLDSLGPRIHLTIQGVSRPVSASVQHALLRISQEALTNIRRHAYANNAELILGFEENQLVLRVEDDGCALDVPPLGFGLKGIAERMEQLGGTCDVEAKAEGGLVMTVSVPW